jgi:small subunit ribosomal protein S25
MKEELRRIRYTNPQLNIEVSKLPKTIQDEWKSEMMVQFGKSRCSVGLGWYSNTLLCVPFYHCTEDGEKTTIDMSNKWSTTIAKELMDLAGGDPWKEHKAAAQAAGLPVLPGEETERLAAAKKRTPKLTTRSPENLEAMVENMLSSPERPKTGAAAILP